MTLRFAVLAALTLFPIGVLWWGSVAVFFFVLDPAAGELRVLAVLLATPAPDLAPQLLARLR